MRVLHVTKATGVSGSERHLLSMIPELRERGVEVGLVVLAGPGAESFLRALAARDVEVRTVPAGWDANPPLVARLRRQFRELAPDVVHTHLIHADVHGQVAARWAGLPAVSTVHSSHHLYRRQPYRSAAWLAGHLAKRTIAISQHVAGTIAEAGIVAAERVTMIPYGIEPPGLKGLADTSRLRLHFGAPEARTVVGVASRLIPGKGHDVLIRAVAEARRRGVLLHLLVAGDGPTRPALAALASSEGVGDQVSFLGFLDDIGGFLAACDVVAFPTQPDFGEGFGLVALEGMAAGLPVVATRVASLPEIVVDGRTGVLTEPADIRGLAEVLVRMADDALLRSRLGAAGRQRALEQFSLGAMIDRTVAVYEEVLCGRLTSTPSSAGVPGN